MNWFERLTGFRETNYTETQRNLEVDGQYLRSRINGAKYKIGTLEVADLASLRRRAIQVGGLAGRLKMSVVQGDVRKMHQDPKFAGALFQVASQFNLLEMPSYGVTPERGVSDYEFDRTQGPACAIAAGAATVYRNYFAPFGNQIGQTEGQQINALEGLGNAISMLAKVPVGELWTMRNGYALCTEKGLGQIATVIEGLSEEQRSELRDKLCIGIHSGIEVTDAPSLPGPTVSQVFCSALPVSYTSVASRHWKAFATLVLEAAYEATIWAGVLNAQRGDSNIVLLTRLGGGAFGNDDEWIHMAMERALKIAKPLALDIRLVSHGMPSVEMTQMAGLFDPKSE